MTSIYLCLLYHQFCFCALYFTDAIAQDPHSSENKLDAGRKVCSKNFPMVTHLCYSRRIDYCKFCTSVNENWSSCIKTTWSLDSLYRPVADADVLSHSHNIAKAKLDDIDFLHLVVSWYYIFALFFPIGWVNLPMITKHQKIKNLSLEGHLLWLVNSLVVVVYLMISVL